MEEESKHGALELVEPPPVPGGAAAEKEEQASGSDSSSDAAEGLVAAESAVGSGTLSSPSGQKGSSSSESLAKIDAAAPIVVPGIGGGAESASHACLAQKERQHSFYAQEAWRSAQKTRHA